MLRKAWLMVNKDTADQIKCFIEERRGYSIFMLVQSLILLCLIAGLFGKAVTIELDAQNLEIRDEKVIVNEHHSFYISGWNDETSYGRWVAGTGLFDLKQGMYEVSVAYQSLCIIQRLAATARTRQAPCKSLRDQKRQRTSSAIMNSRVFQDGHTRQRTRLCGFAISAESRIYS